MACLLNTLAPLGEGNFGVPPEILAVFRQDGNCYVSVKSLQVYSASDPQRTVIDYRPKDFEVEQFKRMYPEGAHHSIMKELDRRVAELEKVEMERKAKATTWCEKLMSWLRPISVCLTADDGYTSGCVGHTVQPHGPESRPSSYDDQDKVYCRASQQPTMMQRTPTDENTHRAVPAEGTNIRRPPTAASTVSTLVNCTNQSPTRYEIAQPNTHHSQTILQPSRPRFTPDHELSSTMREDTIIAAEDTVLWIGSLEAVSDVGVRARKVLVRRGKRCRLVQEDISFDKLCSGRERRIEAIVGSSDYIIAWRLHQSKAGCQHPLFTGPPLEQLLAARYLR